MLVAMDETSLTFVERSDPDARASLGAVQERLRTTGATTRLLRGRSEPGTFLLIVSGDAALNDTESAGARVWRFDAIDATDAGEVRA